MAKLRGECRASGWAKVLKYALASALFWPAVAAYVAAQAPPAGPTVFIGTVVYEVQVAGREATLYRSLLPSQVLLYASHQGSLATAQGLLFATQGWADTTGLAVAGAHGSVTPATDATPQWLATHKRVAYDLKRLPGTATVLKYPVQGLAYRPTGADPKDPWAEVWVHTGLHLAGWPPANPHDSTGRKPWFPQGLPLKMKLPQPPGAEVEITLVAVSINDKKPVEAVLPKPASVTTVNPRGEIPLGHTPASISRVTIGQPK